MRLKRFQFSLRTLLAVVLGIGVLSCVGYWAYPRIIAANYWRQMKDADFVEPNVAMLDVRTAEILAQWAMRESQSKRRSWGVNLVQENQFHSSETIKCLTNLMEIDSDERTNAANALANIDLDLPELSSFLQRKLSGKNEEKLVALKLLQNLYEDVFAWDWKRRLPPPTEKLLINTLDDPNEAVQLEGLITVSMLRLDDAVFVSKLKKLESADAVRVAKLATRILNSWKRGRIR